MKTKIFDWSTEQADRFQALLNNCDSDLDDFQLDEALQDFIDFEEDESQIMTLDTFKERLSIRN